MAMPRPSTPLKGPSWQEATGEGTEGSPFVPVVTTPGGGIAAAPAMTRPADTTAYASGDLVANSTTAGSVVPLVFNGVGRVQGGGVRIIAARIAKSGTGVTNAAFRLHLFSSAPSLGGGDNAALAMGPLASYLGALDITVDRALTDGSFGRGVPLVGVIMVAKLGAAETRLWGLLEARGAYTPASGEAFTVTLELERD